MRPLTQTLPLLAAALLLLLSAPPACARRVRVRPAQRPTAVAEDDSPASAPAAADQETNPQHIRYYAAQPSDADDAQQGGVVLVSSDPYNGLYGRPTARTQTDEAQLRSALASSRAYSAAAAQAQTALSRPRVKETAKQPPVQTIRNYSKVNDDGSFTFGYEAADGSFKEETRGTDCVVRGKYGYVDPDGNKREFTYVSGNPCDPNAVQEEEEEQQREAADSGEENIPKDPRRPLRPLRPAPATVAPRPTTTVFEQNYQAEDEGEDALDDAPQQLFTPTPRPRYVHPAPTPSPTPGYSSYVSSAAQPVRITPRPPLPSVSTTPRSQLPATTYRPQLLQLAVTPRPGVVYTKSPLQARPTPAPQPSYIGSSTPTIDFDEELRKFQLENNVLTTAAPARAAAPQPTPRPIHAQPVRAQYPQPQPQQHYQFPQQQQQPQPQQQQSKVPSGDPIYTSELVYDPSTGQYNTVLYQQLPQTTGELNLRHRLQPYVHQPLLQPQPSQQHQQQQPQSQYYQQQQSALLAQSQQLYAQQQQQRAIAQQQRFLQQQQLTTQATTRSPPRYTAQPVQQAQQAQPQHQSQAQYYFVTPSANAAQGNPLAQGQIEAFLRGHNIAF